MARLTREQQQQHNRGLLVEAAERIFASRGVAGASLDDVALEAGLTKGAVYSNFANKGELVLAVIRARQTISPEAREFHRVLEQASNDYERLEAWCDAWIATARSGERSNYARLLFDFIPYALRNADLTEQFLRFISPGDDPTQPSPMPSDSRFGQLPVADQFRILTALDLGLAALAILDPDGTDPTLYKTAIMSLAHTSYQPDDSQQPENTQHSRHKPHGQQ